MAYSLGFISSLVTKIKSGVVDNHVSKVILFNKTDFVLALSRNRKQRFYISLNNAKPFITLTAEDFPVTTLASAFFQILKKEISDSLILDIAMVHGDRIVLLDLEKTTDAYRTYRQKLYIELIPGHPNMILTDENNVIMTAFKPSPSLENVRPLIRGLTYVFPEKNFSEIGASETVDLEKIYHEHALAALAEHKSEKYEMLFQFVKKRMVTLKRKMVNLHDDLEKAQARLADRDKGTLLLTYLDSISEGDSSVTRDGITVELEPRLSPAKNAEKYFKSYQKAKIAILRATEQKTIAEKQLDYFTFILIQAESAGDEELEEIQHELVDEGFLPAPTFLHKKLKEKAILPYFIMVDDVKIGFGKNNMQNDYLTFKLAKNQHYFLHIKNDRGAHVIIFDDNPNANVKTCAAEIALLLSKKTDGEVNITKKSEVKKANSPGLVKFDHYQTIHINKIRTETEQKLKEAHR
ncbi:MAG: NFACT family protein [Firmicutes bacterium]|nr:NFACT family protein [Bacillota bacterium]